MGSHATNPHYNHTLLPASQYSRLTARPLRPSLETMIVRSGQSSERGLIGVFLGGLVLLLLVTLAPPSGAFEIREFQEELPLRPGKFAAAV